MRRSAEVGRGSHGLALPSRKRSGARQTCLQLSQLALQAENVRLHLGAAVWQGQARVPQERLLLGDALCQQLHLACLTGATQKEVRDLMDARHLPF